MPLVKIADLNGTKKEVNDLIDRASQISQLYDDYIEGEKGDGHLRAPGIHASEISACPRRVVYSIRGTRKEEKIPKIWRQRFQMGKYVHSMIQSDFHHLAYGSKGRIFFESEVKISPHLQAIAGELNIHSACDGIITFCDRPYGPATLRVGLEIKTASPDSYEKLHGPKPDHIEQAHIYMRCLDLPLMYFMYFNKGNQNNTDSAVPFLIEFDPDLWMKLEARCRKLLQVAEHPEELPPRQESIGCSWCPYAYTCQPTSLGKRSSSASWTQLRRS